MSRVRVVPGNINLSAITRQLSELQARVGWFESAQYPDGTPAAYVAAIHEYGYPEGGIPSRAYFRPAIANNQTRWRDTVKAGAKKIVQGEMTPYAVLELVALQAEGDIRKSLVSVKEPPLKESTLRARARRRNTDVASVNPKPLQDTGFLLGSLTAQVENKNNA